MRGANTRRPGSTPRASASFRKFRSAVALSRSSHNTLPSTACNSRIQTSNTSGVIFQLLLKEQNTKPSSGIRLPPRWHALGDLPLGVVDLIAIRQVNDLLRIKRLVFERHYRLVGDDVVDELGPHRAGKAEIACLDRRRTIRKNAGPQSSVYPLKIDRNIDLEFTQELGNFLVAFRPHVKN